MPDTGGDAVERYLYEPYGVATIYTGDWSSTRSSSSYNNVYRYTGRRYDPNTGLYHYRRRHYHAPLGRFLTRDPIGYRAGDGNLYRYVFNAPLSRTDPTGNAGIYDSPNPTTPLWPGGPMRARPTPYGPPAPHHNERFLCDFLLGLGETDRVYGPDSLQLPDMQRSPGADKLRDAFYKGGCKGVTGFSYGTGEAAGDTIPWHLSDTSFQVGGFGGATAHDNGDGTVTFTITNQAGAHSFFYHILPNAPWSCGPMRTITQTFQWTEKIDKSRCCQSVPSAPAPPSAPPPPPRPPIHDPHDYMYWGRPTPGKL